MKVTIKEVHSVFAWSWLISNHAKENGESKNDVDDEEDVCGICRASFNATCPGCTYPGDECPLVVGDCNHSFHVHCIYRWLDTTSSKGLCPMCRQPFQLKRGLAINDSHIKKFQDLHLRRTQGQAQEALAEGDEEALGRVADQQSHGNGIIDEQGDVIMEQGLVVR
ncbi:hypothetical protein HG535_0C02460 [Zygotorulaspora mrakii]|uniref:Anaphase-promoting complex subunit 11 n=1 Tax=Zygotorulaspora mrakii TaxID=42260 RepID=A0A7H9B079_ZYGMR|nr:uncharacterized protein HG535_0C02460 [Zygotorulaspora mrakii]QLG71896.1 hypothetical protein HG535_0C02460 [Zygotorulaspora mrakii]